MSKILSVMLIIAATFAIGLSQETSQSQNNPPSRGVAPKVADGIGRADVRVFDESGDPIRNAYVKLESTRSDGFFCESWDNTDERGIAALPPLHMGTLKLKVKAKGFKTQEVEIPAGDLDNPVRVTLKKK